MIYILAIQEKNDEIINDCFLKLQEIHKSVKKNEINCFLSGENDDLNIYLKSMLVLAALKVRIGLIC